MAAELGGRLLVLGTPAEEGGGGKKLMMDAGALEGVDAALMVHPAGFDLRTMDVIAVQRCTATYTGEAAHARPPPEKGRNALDAAVLGYVNVAALRQHIPPTSGSTGSSWRAATSRNIVPARTVAEWYVRSPHRAGLAALRDRVAACLEAGAAAAGCEIAFDWYEPAYADMLG